MRKTVKCEVEQMSEIRLDKYISMSMTISRKDAANLIKASKVALNGKTVRKADEKIDPGADICTVCGKSLEYRENYYFMLNKPSGLVCAASDSRCETVLSLFPKSYTDKGLFCCGRLDKDTVGLLLLTTDGALSHRLLSPKHHAKKTYLVRTDAPFCSSDAKLMSDGIMMDGKKTAPAILEIDAEDPCTAKITLTEGKYHEIKRLCYACGRKEVLYLKRLTFGGLSLDETLKEGEYRELTKEETEILRAN